MKLSLPKRIESPFDIPTMNMKHFAAFLVIIVTAAQAFAGIVPASATFARPSNTDAYTAGDVVSNSASTTTPMTLNLPRDNGYIVGARLVTDTKSITPRIRVHVYSTSSITVSADNAAMRSLYADRTKKIGAFDLPAMATPSDTSNSTQSSASDVLFLRLPYVIPAGQNNVYIVLETLDAFNPSSGQNFFLELIVDA